MQQAWCSSDSRDEQVHRCSLLNPVTHSPKHSCTQSHSCRCQGSHITGVWSSWQPHEPPLPTPYTGITQQTITHTGAPHTRLDTSHPPSAPRGPMHHPMGAPHPTPGLQVTFILSDTASLGPVSVVSSRHSQKQNLTVVAGTHAFLGAPPPAGGGPVGGRNQAGQSSASSPSDPASAGSRCLPLDRARQPLTSTPGPLPWARWRQTVSISVCGLCPGSPSIFIPDSPLELCRGHRPVPDLPCLHPKPRRGEE